MPSAGIILGVLVLGMSGWAIFSATGWPWKAALFPLVIGIPVLLLAAAELYLTVAGRTETSRTRAIDLTAQTRPVDSSLARRRTLVIFGWIAALFLLVMGIGFLAAVPAFVFLYLRLQAHEPWPISLALPAAAWALVYGLFVRLLHLPFAEGVVQAWLHTLGVLG